MQVWLIKDGELLPVDDATRPMRMGMLANALLDRGHSVVWWSSTFSHQHRKLRKSNDCEIQITPKFTLRMLHAGSYRRNISYARYRHHQLLGRRFRDRADSVNPPDALVCALPINEVAAEAVDYARIHGIPSIVDIRDLWPDLWVEKGPSAARPLLRALLYRKYKQTRRLLQDATSVVAVSRQYLEWGVALGQRAAPFDRVFYIGYPDTAPVSSIPQRVQALRRRLGSRSIVVFAGSFGASCDLNLLCDAAQEVFNEGRDDVHFVLAGDGAQSATVSRRVRALPNVTLTGWLSRDETSALLSISDIALAPYQIARGRVPNKLFEYMAAGLPIISSLSGEAAALVENGGYGLSYDLGAKTEFLKHLRQLLDDKELRLACGCRARAAYQKHFKSDSIYSLYAEHIETLADAFNTVLEQRVPADVV